MKTDPIQAFRITDTSGTVRCLQPGDHWITVTYGMSGHFAVEMWINPGEGGLGPFPEPWDTGFGRYLTPAEAQAEAVAWGHQAGLPISI